mmetsp:Transcript_56047/g.135664  ORF Transcript_56047/g.135664 Transcript_56047/m.135664 type:complete len:1330 (+) Transcript_56047:258-4247(+)
MASETAAPAVRLPDMNGGLKTGSDNDDDANNSDSTATGDKEITMTGSTTKSQAAFTADESASPSTSTSTKPESKKDPTATVSSSSSAAADAESEVVRQTSSPTPPKEENGEGVTSQSRPSATSNNDGGEGRRRNSSLDELGTFEENVSLGSFDPPSSLGDKQRSDSILSGPSMNSQQSLLSSSSKKGLPITSATEMDSGEPSSTVEVAKASSSSSSSSKQADSNGVQSKSDVGRIRQCDDHNGDTADHLPSSGGENNDDTDATDAAAIVSAPSAVAAKAAAAAAASVSEVAATEATSSSSKPIPIVAPAPSVLLSQEYGRRPFRKRKGSVDFSFALDDNGSNTSSRRKRQNSNDESNHSNSKNNRGSDFHHSMDALPPMGALPDIEVSGDNAKDDHTVLSSTAAAAAASAGSTPASAIPPPPLSPLDSTQTLTGSASGIASTAGRTRSRTNSSAGVGSANTAAVESLLSMGSSSSKGSGDGDPDGNLKMAPPDAPMKDMSKNQRLRKDSAASHPSRARKNSHVNSTAGSNSTRRRFRAYSEDNFSQGSNSHETLTSQSHRFLLEAFMGDGTESLVLDPEQRERLGSFDGVSGVGESAGSGVVPSLPKSDTDETNRPTGLAAAAAPAVGAAVASAGAATHDQAATNHTSRERFASIDYGRRERLESWGGMSDLSGHGLHDHPSDTLGSGTNNSSTAAALAATIYTSLANDVTAAADGNESISSFLVPDETIPTRIAVNRDRMNSIASVATDPSALLHGTVGAVSGTNADAEFPSEMQKYVKAAMASVGDQLAGIAASAEAVAGLSFHDGKDHQDESEISSNASPLLGDLGSKSGSLTGRPRSSSVSSLLNIAVDYDAVAAAVDAAEAAAGAVDLTNFTSTDVGTSAPSRGGRRKRKGLPLNRKDIPSSNLLSSISELHGGDRHIDELRAEARAAAGYFPPSDTPHALPPKKRAKMYKESPDQVRSSSATAPTPTISNKKSSSKKKQTKSVAGSGGGQANQKWDSMLEALKEYAREREEEETKHMTEEQKAYWSWDGNVPTMYKTKDGKPLGRWVNNQRTAKSKGSLKEEREERLVAAGLKWTVQASSSWNEMLEELKVYIADKAKNGEDWDGNVPTNYCIKLTKNPCEDDEKNLGRWVNRQRSMFQAGKLRKDRQVALESVGLKWSVLTSITWDSMFDTLKEYVEEKKQNNGGTWDGNVPATYKTVKVDPPRALGRWINRQRSAYSKGKLKEEYVNKLNSIGLRWSIHDRKGKKPPPPPPSASSNASIKGENNDDDEIVVEKTTNVFEAVNERAEQADRDGKTILIDNETESGPLDKAADTEDVEVARSG